MAERFEMFRLADMHVHFRRGAMLKAVVPESATQCHYVLPMPNAGVYTAEDVVAYKQEIKAARGGDSLEPVMSIYITPNTTVQDVFDAYQAGARNGKIYPKNLTTNAEDGVEDYYALEEVYAAMQECGMVLSLHGELPGEEIHALDRELKFLPIAKWIIEEFRGLKVVLEHLTTRVGVNFVSRARPGVAATITLHHLFITFNDVVEPKLHPHLFCKPLVKRHEDREALIRAALSGDPKFFLGSDTAPHLLSTKECAECCAGVYTAPVLAPMLVDFFKSHGADKQLLNFACFSGPRFYGLPEVHEPLVLERAQWRVPNLYPVEGHHDDGIVPFMAGEVLYWRVV